MGRPVQFWRSQYSSPAETRVALQPDADRGRAGREPALLVLALLYNRASAGGRSDAVYWLAGRDEVRALARGATPGPRRWLTAAGD